MQALAEGTIIGARFRIEALVATTATATIYRCSQLVGQKVFLKILKGVLLKDREDRGRFEREYKVLSMLEHPNVASVYELGYTDAGEPFISLEYLEGETLKQRLERGPLPAADTVEITRQLLGVLTFVHGKGIVHRDLEPGSLFLVASPDGRPSLKIFSFGVARTGAKGDRGQGTILTQYGATLGSASEYMPPEQARGDEVDARSDVYSVGCLVYAMLAGRPPFAESEPGHVIIRHIREVPRPVRDLRRDAPAWLDRWTQRALRKKPLDRFESSSAALVALDNAAGGVATDLEAAPETELDLDLDLDLGLAQPIPVAMYDGAPREGADITAGPAFAPKLGIGVANAPSPGAPPALEAPQTYAPAAEELVGRRAGGEIMRPLVVGIILGLVVVGWLIWYAYGGE